MITNTEALADAALLSDSIERAGELHRSQVIAAMDSPLDASLKRGNPRQHHGGPSLFDARDPMKTPNMAFAPEQVTSLPEYAELEGWGVGLAVEALKSMQGVVSNLLTARETYKSDPTLTEAAQVLAVDDLHNKLMPAATKRLDAANATVTKAIEAQEAELRKGFTSSSPFAAEIRAHAKALSAGDRIKFINEATAAGDMTTLAAVLGAPPYLSGLDAKMAATLTELANKARFPQTAKRLALLRGAQVKLEAAGSVAVGSYEAILGVRDATVRKLRAQREKVRTVLNGIAPAA